MGKILVINNTANSINSAALKRYSPKLPVPILSIENLLLKGKNSGTLPGFIISNNI